MLNNYTMTISPPNKYHEDDMIDEFLEFVRYTKNESDAIYNIHKIIKRYTKKEKNTNHFLLIWFIIWLISIYFLIK